MTLSVVKPLAFEWIFDRIFSLVNFWFARRGLLTGFVRPRRRVFLQLSVLDFFVGRGIQ